MNQDDVELEDPSTSDIQEQGNHGPDVLVPPGPQIVTSIPDLNDQEKWVDRVHKGEVTDKLLETNRTILYTNTKPKQCVRCGRTADTNTKIKESHIIPKSILKFIQDVYCYGATTFLHDITGGATNANTYKYPLLCGNCEVKFDFECPKCKKGNDECKCKGKQNVEENLFRIFQVMAGLEAGNCENPDCGVTRLFAEIMLRGVFVIDDKHLDTLLKNYRDEVIKLWKFGGGLDKASELCLFLLPKRPIADGCPIELVNWAPQQTVYCQTTEAGNFLYTHFNRFHIVLPLDEGSITYFQKYRPANLLGYKIEFNQRNFPQFKVDSESKATLHDTADMSSQFPTILIKVNAERYKRYHCENFDDETTKDALTLAFEKKLIKGFIIETNVFKKEEMPEKKEKPPELDKLSRTTIPFSTEGSNIGILVKTLHPYSELIEKAKSSHLLTFFQSEDKRKNKELQKKVDDIEQENKELKKQLFEDKEKKRTNWFLTPREINPTPINEAWDWCKFWFNLIMTIITILITIYIIISMALHFFEKYKSITE